MAYPDSHDVLRCRWYHLRHAGRGSGLLCAGGADHDGGWLQRHDRGDGDRARWWRRCAWLDLESIFDWYRCQVG